jgi:hypothetical protein
MMQMCRACNRSDVKWNHQGDDGSSPSDAGISQATKWRTVGYTPPHV